MTDERWQVVKALFQATVERPPSERAAFLADAAAGDEALRREVQSLLESDGADPAFTDRLPLAGESPLRSSAAPSSPDALTQASVTSTGVHLAAGRRVGPYEIIEFSARAVWEKCPDPRFGASCSSRVSRLRSC